MRRGDIVELLATQHLAPPLPDVPKGTLGEVTSTPPALWIFTFPGYAGPVQLDDYGSFVDPGPGSTGHAGTTAPTSGPS